MTSTLDIDRSALLLIRHYGERALLKAAIRADELLEAGDIEGCRVWRQIITAIEKLQAQLPKPGQAVH